MAQAFDREGSRLGEELFGDSMQEVFEKALLEHPDAHEIRVRKTLPEEVVEGGTLREAIAAELREAKDDLSEAMLEKVEGKVDGEED